MTELEILKRAKDYIESLAQGKNPLDGSSLPDSDIVNNVRIARCMFYVSGVLQKVIDNSGEVQRQALKRSQKDYFFLSAKEVNCLLPSEEPQTISQLTAYLNTFIDELTMRKLQAATVNRWLVTAGFLSEERDEYGQMQKRVTDDGKEIGIREREREHDGRHYVTIIHTPQAQQFIFDNITAIAEFAAAEIEQKREEKQLRSQAKLHDKRLTVVVDDDFT